MSWLGFGTSGGQRKRHRYSKGFLEGTGTLAELGSGQKAKIVRIGGSGQIRHRLMDLGFHIGETVEMIKSAPLKDPLEIAVNGGRISIRCSEAGLINVDLIPVSK
jgi:ferrous iron transport protein A